MSKAKPEVSVEVLPYGTIRLGNICAAARWAGVSTQTFADILRRHIRNRRNGDDCKKGMTPKEKILAAYPELFA